MLQPRSKKSNSYLVLHGMHKMAVHTKLLRKSINGLYRFEQEEKIDLSLLDKDDTIN